MRNLNKFYTFLENNEKFILTGHENPDGDAIGSEYALCRHIKKCGKEAEIITCENIPYKYSFIDEKKIIRIIENEDELPEDLEKYVLIILDTNTPYNTGNIYNYLKDRIKDIFIIDHHENPDEDNAINNYNCIETDASSSCEIVYRIIKNNKINTDITEDMARAMYAGIVYDTGSFIYPKTSQMTLHIASELVKKGLKPNIIYSHMYESNSLSSLKLHSKVFSGIEFFHDHRTALQIMTKNILEKFNASYEDGDTIINIPLKCRDIKVSVFFKENNKGVLRCSLRSKDNLDVASIARSFGGGGHTTAAGFKCSEPLEIIMKKVLKEINKIYQAD